MFTSPNAITKKQKTHTLSASRMTRIATIAALYAALTLLCITTLSGLAWGPVQFRLSEALCILALFTADAIPGLTLGCAIANIANIALSGTGMLGMLDVIFGSLATLMGTAFIWRFRQTPRLALLGPVVANALIVPAYLPLLLQGLGFYTIPFTGISLDGAWLPMYIFGFVFTALGEAVVIYLLGIPLYTTLKGSPLPSLLRDDIDAEQEAEEA